MKTVCFDLEGPLSPQDNAFEVSGEIEQGKKLFEKISKYDDHLAQKNKTNHEPGDTLALIAPFLVLEDIKEEDIKKVSNSAKIVSGAKELIKELKKEGWEVYIISTSYKQHAYNIGKKLGIQKENIYATNLNLKEINKKTGKELREILESAKKKIIETNFSKELINYLNDFFFSKLPDSNWGHPLDKIKVRGGARKNQAVKKIAKEKNVPLSEITVIGDSITDFKMLNEIKEEGGESIVFNGNEFAIPFAKFAVASLDLRIIKPILLSKNTNKVVNKWEKNQKEINKDLEKMPIEFKKHNIQKLFEGSGVRKPVINYLLNKSEDELNKIIEVHKYFRENVRGEAAKLG